MAFSTVDVHIQNPARAGKGKRAMAKTKRRKLSAKQIKAGFGGKRRKAAAKSSRPKHRARTKPNPSRKRRVVAKAAPVKRRKKRAVAKRSTAKRRKNPTPMIISWAAGNPAKRRTNKVATKRRKKRATAKRSNPAGRRRVTKRRVTHRRRNPGTLGNPMTWIQGGAGVVVGAAGARLIPQMLMGASNSGPMGYLANAGAALGLGYLTHMLFPRNPVLTAAVIAGGFGSLISRVMTEKSPILAPYALAGLGDAGLGLYQKSNFPYPQRIQNGRLPSPGSSMFNWGAGGQGAMSTVANAGSDSMSAC